MSNENKSIHEFDFSLICEYFASVERQGPGSPEATLKALSFIDNLNSQSFIADLGCGTGGQTRVMARSVSGQITGLDIFPQFIDIFNEQALKSGLSEHVHGVVGSMDALPFEPESLDLIWSEGAIYNIGFERGINEWRQYLKTGAYLAVTESSWFTEERPEGIERFWMEAYPEINTIPVKVNQLQQAGYMPVAVFALPEDCWREHYHQPQKEVQDNFLKKYAGNKMVEDFITFQRHEAALYEKYSAYYGYVFYIGKKL